MILFSIKQALKTANQPFKLKKPPGVHQQPICQTNLLFRLLILSLSSFILLSTVSSSHRLGLWSHRIFRRYTANLPTSLSCISSVDKRCLVRRPAAVVQYGDQGPGAQCPTASPLTSTYRLYTGGLLMSHSLLGRPFKVGSFIPPARHLFSTLMGGIVRDPGSELQFGTIFSAL